MERNFGSRVDYCDGSTFFNFNFKLMKSSNIFFRDGKEIAVVYFRTGYSPSQYKSQHVRILVNPALLSDQEHFQIIIIAIKYKQYTFSLKLMFENQKYKYLQVLSNLPMQSPVFKRSPFSCPVTENFM